MLTSRPPPRDAAPIPLLVAVVRAKVERLGLI
jgi:hypothetical protein